MFLSAAIDLIYRTVAKHTSWMQRHVACISILQAMKAAGAIHAVLEIV